MALTKEQLDELQHELNEQIEVVTQQVDRLEFIVRQFESQAQIAGLDIKQAREIAQTLKNALVVHRVLKKHEGD